MKRFPTIKGYADGFSRLKLNGVEWRGVRITNQDEADDQVPKLLRTEAAKRFVLYEPALGPVIFAQCWCPDGFPTHIVVPNSLPVRYRQVSGIDWLIVGGESGPRARPCNVAWIRSAVEQCRDAGVPCFVKQLGARPVARISDDMGDEFFRSWDSFHAGEPFPIGGVTMRLRAQKGCDPSEWPEDLRVREWPR